jgi:hypothetical protein
VLNIADRSPAEKDTGEIPFGLLILDDVLSKESTSQYEKLKDSALLQMKLTSSKEFLT